MARFGKKQDPTRSAFPKLRSSLLLASRKLNKMEFEMKLKSYMWAFNQYLRATSQGRVEKVAPFLPAEGRGQPEGTSPSSSQSPFTGSSATQPSKRRKAECCYDIAIPVSVTAAAGVEQPQGKEIVVPSWRIVELEELQPFSQADSELEDTSDEMYPSRHSRYEDIERARWDSWAASPSHKQGSRSSSKAEARWAGQPQPASPVTRFNCLNDLAAPPATGLHSPEACTSLPPLSVRHRTRMVLSCSEDAVSPLEMLDDAIRNVQPWEPRTFPLSNSACQGLLQRSGEGGCDQAGFQPWLSGNTQGIRPSSVGTVIPAFTGMRFSDRHLRTDGNKSVEEFMVQCCNPGKPVNNDKPDLWCV